jgi:OOP family OmpA-OmpF porin
MRTAVLAICCLLTAAPALADNLPTYVKLPAQAQVVPDSVAVEDYGEAEIQLTEDPPPEMKRGKHYTATLAISGLPEDAVHEQLLAPFRAALKSAGWTVVHEWVDTNPAMATVHYQKQGVDAWAKLSFFGINEVNLDLVETGAPKLDFTLKPPAATPEKIGDQEPFPYITPPPGSTFSNTSGEDTGPIMVLFKGDEEQTLVAPGSVTKTYSRPPRMSTLLFVTLYRNALTKAGWQVLEEFRGSDAVLTVHYARNGRDIWAYLHLGEDIAVKVGDVGAANLAAALQKDCHVALYGVTFDFNKATLRLDSEAVLGKALGALQSNAQLAVEVQGHTDNVGGDDYNLKLSQSRAEAVKSWLAGHGIAAARLTAKGYGRSHPVADNESPEGRAKNRRVELARPNCK